MGPKINFSGYLQQTVLFSLSDLDELMVLLAPFSFFNVSAVQSSATENITPSSFRAFYETYLKKLFEENALDERQICHFFSLALASDESFFERQTFANDRFLLKPKRSVIQCQPLGLFISSLDGQIHIKTFAKQVQSFGLKFNFATIYEDTASHTLHELTPDDSQYHKFVLLRQFVRRCSTPLIIESDGVKKPTAVRYSSDLKSQVREMPFFYTHNIRVI